MTKTLEQRKAQRIRELVSSLEGRSGGALKSRFVRQFYAHVPPRDILGRSVEDLQAPALALWRLGWRRRPDEVRLRVYTPSAEKDGWSAPYTVVEIVNDDMPFLVDSVIAALEREGHRLRLIVHPVLSLQRDRSGRLRRLLEPGEATAGSARRESWIQMLTPELPPERQRQLEARLLAVLEDVREVVRDWEELRGRCSEVAEALRRDPPSLPPEEVEETAAFLDWIHDDHFTFLGYREYRFRGSGKSAVAQILGDRSLGLLRDEDFRVYQGLRDLGRLPADVRQFVSEPTLLRITKAPRRSTVHRRAYMDAVAIKTFDARGRVAGEHVFLGLFTSAAYSQSVLTIPLLRRRVERVLARAAFPSAGHDEKRLLHVLETYPRDELFQAREEDLLASSTEVLRLQERPRTALIARRDPFGRFVSCLVFVPRERYDTALRQRFQEILAEAYAGRVVAYDTLVADSPLARLHTILATQPGKVPAVEPSAVERRLVDAARSWVERLEDALIAEHGDTAGCRLAGRYRHAFPPAYQTRFDVATALFDIGQLERLRNGSDLALHLYRPEGAPDWRVCLKVYAAGRPLPISDVLPMLEHMGLEVQDEVPYEIRPGGGDEPIWVRDFEMLSGGARPIEISEVRDAFHQTFDRVWHGEMEDDGFNRLVLHAGLAPREVMMLRAYAKYLRQTRAPFSLSAMQRALGAQPRIARLLVELFRARFDPAAEGDARERAAAVERRISRRLRGVASPDDDRILRRYVNLLRATLRTNFFQRASDGGAKPYLAFKLDSRAVEGLPAPRPYREIWVFGPRVEGIHLRGGPVARGGIRWSDRREDFRTEILGLMKAQMVKNAVIVPVGSKGGFVVKRPPEGSREALQAEVATCYRTLIRGLLDLTDNRIGDQIVPPAEVVRWDGDDPYLVVAADKGTATFSDLANEEARHYGFWLDDAFASGGSAGYDHKKMGITARGAWESVKRHFRELGKDIESESCTVVGIGDMSGDVFGNGMLLSRHLKLVGAFNHQHVFIDPNPDPASSWRERKRLFKLPRSTWSDYDPTLISKGGGVFERRAKAIPVTPEMRRRFGVSGRQIAPDDLVRALLRSEVELLWFGGIGTFVKATEESHAAADDRSNDTVRVDASEVRARVLAEGANLGLTQRARIELGLEGVRLNTDFIDNSAGVDTSDHEVNIKILLHQAMATGALQQSDRNALLREMTDEVAALVLRDNYLQTQALTVTHSLGSRLLDRMARFIRALERKGRLDPRLEDLPDEEELAERARRGTGLTRPELAVLLAHAKLDLYEDLLASDLPDDPHLQEDLERYFPTAIRDRFPLLIAGHRLRREIIATTVTNGVINRAGIAFVHEVLERTETSADAVARAAVVSRQVLHLREVWHAIEALDTRVPAAVQAAMLLECGRLLERFTVWFLREEAELADLGALIRRYEPGVQEVIAALGSLIAPEDGRRVAQGISAFTANGVPARLAQRVARFRAAPPACDLVRIGETAGTPVRRVAEVYFAVGRRFGIDWLRRVAASLPSENAWDKQALTALVDDLYGHQRALTRQVLERQRGARAAAVEAWAGARQRSVERLDVLLRELQATRAPSLAMLAVASRQLKSLAGQP